MRAKLFFISIFFLAAFTANAQKTGYINTQTILSQLSEYNVAQQKLESLSKEYMSEVEKQMQVVEQMYNTYMSQKSSLSEQQRQVRENEIIEKERAAKELQKSYFGQDGAMQKKSEELLSPIKGKVQQAIDKVAKIKGYGFILDLAIMQGVIYFDPQYDITEFVLEELK